MPVSILIPAVFREHTGSNRVSVEAATVTEAIHKLIERHPALRVHLYTEEDQLQHFIRIFLNHDDIRYLQHGETTLLDGDEVAIVPAVADAT